jgi:hypothetical protein
MSAADVLGLRTWTGHAAGRHKKRRVTSGQYNPLPLAKERAIEYCEWKNGTQT